MTGVAGVQELQELQELQNAIKPSTGWRSKRIPMAIPILQYSNTPILQSSTTPVLQHSVTPATPELLLF
jgi:hypothetical protein